ncbi:integrase [Elusimicrobium simillimum]|uniref:tyrosine-type recombinase/integrase n=1 Tax=Elusimicrobium simillimum TaxID=3143438 RepID=UPI003C6F4995
MGLVKRKDNGIWYASYYINGRHVRASLKTKEKRVAEVKYSDILRKKTIEDTPGINTTFTAFKTRYEDFLKSERSQKTLVVFNTAVKKLNTIKDVKMLSEITPELLQKLKQKYINKDPHKHLIGNAGLNRSIRALKTMMRQAETWRLVPKQNWEEVSKLKENKGRLEFFSEKELKILIKTCKKEWRLVVLLGARAGLRRSEIELLKWADIDFKNNHIYVAPNKTEKGRFVPIPADLLAELKSYPKKVQSPYVINVGKARFSKDYISGYLTKLIEEAGLTGSTHKLRHTFASHLVQNGVDLYSVSKLLGHTSIKTTEIYAHLNPRTLQDAIKKLPKIK